MWWTIYCYGFGLREPVCLCLSEPVWVRRGESSLIFSRQTSDSKVSESKLIILNIVVFCVCPFILMLCIVVKLVSLGRSDNNTIQ